MPVCNRCGKELMKLEGNHCSECISNQVDNDIESGHFLEQAEQYNRDIAFEENAYKEKERKRLNDV